MASAIFVEGINQSGKSTTVSAFCTLLTQLGYYPIKVKLPYYQTLIGNYIQGHFLPNYEMRPDDLKRSILAQMSLYALNRLEVLPNIRKIVQQLEEEGFGDRVIVVCDRSPLSSLFTDIDALLYGNLNDIIDATEQDIQGILSIKNQIAVAQARGDLFQLTREDDNILKILYDSAIERILYLDSIFLNEFFPMETFILDIPVEVVMAVQRLRDFSKSLDVQEDVAIQTIVRQLYLRTAKDTNLRDIMTIHVINQMRGGERLNDYQIVTEMLELLNIEPRKEADVGYVSIPVCEGRVDFSSHDELEDAFRSLIYHSNLSSVRDAINFATIYLEGRHTSAENE